jgi:hypothetical protein
MPINRESPLVKPSVEEMERLFTQARDHKMGDAYWHDFLGEFHRTERETAAKQPAWLMGLSELRQRFSELGPAKWAYAGGLAYAAVTAAFLLTPREASVHLPSATPVRYETVPAPVVNPPNEPDELDLLSPLEKITGERPGF